MRRKPNGRKSKKTGMYNDISNQRRWNFAFRFNTFDLPPYGKESSCNFKNILEGYVSAKTGYRLPNVHTLHNHVHIVVGGAVGDVSSALNDPIFPLHHSFVDRIYEKWLRKFNKSVSFLEHTMRASDTTKMTSLYHFILCILINRFLRSLSIEFGYDYDDVDENGKYDWSFYMTLIYFSFTLNAILCNCNVAFWRKKILSLEPHCTDTHRELRTVFFFQGKALSFRSITCIC